MHLENSEDLYDCSTWIFYRFTTTEFRTDVIMKSIMHRSTYRSKEVSYKKYTWKNSEVIIIHFILGLEMLR